MFRLAKESPKLNPISIVPFSYSSLTALAACYAVAVFAGPKQTLVADSAATTKPLTVGAKAPNATLQSLSGKDVSLLSLLKRQRTVLIFYRGGWCPYCNAHLSDLVTIEQKLTAKGFQIIAISPDTPAELNNTLTKDHLTYKLFSDSSAEAMKKFGVAYRLDDPTFSKMKDSYGVDLEKFSGQTHHILPVPSVFVINRDGNIVYAHSNADYKVRLKASEILTVIDSMK
jgi:peroxiredoxin